MPANTVPVFVLTPRHPQARISAANTGRDGTGTLVTIFTAGANGAFFKGARIVAEGTTTVGVVRLFVQAAGAGNNELKEERLVPAITPSTTVKVHTDDWNPDAGIMLGAGDVVKAAPHNAETFNVSLEHGGDY